MDSDVLGHWVGVSAASPARRALGAEVSVPTFDQVYRQHFDFVWRVVRRLGVAERAIEDAVQDVFIVVHRRLPEFEGRSSIKTWLYAIARRVAHDHRRRAGRKERADEPSAGLADERGRSPREGAAVAEAGRVLHALLAGLPPAQRDVFVLAELEQMTAPEIAAAVGANVNTVYSRLRLARAAFNQAVARHRARGEGGR